MKFEKIGNPNKFAFPFICGLQNLVQIKQKKSDKLDIKIRDLRYYVTVIIALCLNLCCANYSFATSATDYFRSKATGNWSNAATWQSSTDNIHWGSSTLVPTDSAALITIWYSDTVTVDVNNQTASSLILNYGSTLILKDSNSLLVSSNWTNNGGTFIPDSGTVTFSGNGSYINGTSPTSFYNLIVNETSSQYPITSDSRAFTVENKLTITQGNLILQANDADYVIGGDLIVSTNGTLTHNVEWGWYKLSVGGNIAIDGIYTYAGVARAHVQMNGTGSKTVRTGINSSSAFSILTLMNGNFSASGTLRVNDNFYAMYGMEGSFSTNGQTVYANKSLLNGGGTVYINGGTLNVSHGLYVGYDLFSVAGTVNLSTGILNTDTLIIGNCSVNGTFLQSGSASNINNLLKINSSGTLTCSNSPVINLAGNWINEGGMFTASTGTVNFTGSTMQTILSGGDAFYNVTLANSIADYTDYTDYTDYVAVELADNMKIKGTYSQTTDGLLFIQSHDLTFDTNAVNNISSPSGTRMIVADGSLGSGQVKKVFTENSNPLPVDSFLFPIGTIGDSGVYSPVKLKFTTNNYVRTIGVKVNASTPVLPSPTPLNYVNRYWTFSDDNTDTTYDYTVDLFYASGDINSGTGLGLSAHLYNGTGWTYPNTVNSNQFQINSLVTPAISGSQNTLKNNIYSIFNCTPYLITQPISDSLCIGLNKTFYITTTTTPSPTYQWFKNDTIISHATQNSLFLDSINLLNAGNYKCAVSNICGMDTSSTGSLFIKVPPSVITQPTGNTVCVGDSINLNISATGTNTLTYVWYINNMFINENNTGDYELKITNGINSGTYKCMITNLCGIITSNQAILVVHGSPIITSQTRGK